MSTLSHGHKTRTRTSPTYSSWENMIQRATNPAAVSYPYVGGRGITVCERWRTFTNFLTDMGERPEGKYASGRPMYSLDRIDSDGNYEPGNCRWATANEQLQNRRPYNHRPGLTRTKRNAN